MISARIWQFKYHYRFAPINFQKAVADPAYIRQVLLDGSAKAREIGIKTLEEVRERMNMVI